MQKGYGFIFCIICMRVSNLNPHTSSYGDAAKTTAAAIGDEAEKSHRNSQPFHELASLRNGIAAVVTIASA